MLRQGSEYKSCIWEEIPGNIIRRREKKEVWKVDNMKPVITVGDGCALAGDSGRWCRRGLQLLCSRSSSHQWWVQGWWDGSCPRPSLQGISIASCRQRVACANGTHRGTDELPENWTDTRETLLEGMLFTLKYLGMTLVEQPKGEELSAAAVKRIVATAKASGKKLQKVTLKVSPRGIILTDNTTKQLIENVSIYRISYCTADKMHDKVFAYIAQSQHSENLECHAFLCTKRKMAQAVTLTVAQAFKVAFEFWQVSKEEKEKREKASQEGGDVLGGGRCDSTPSLKSLVATGNLLDLEETAKAPLSTVSANTTNMDEAPRPQALNSSSVVWLDDGLDEAFSRLAQSRTNPQVLDTGLTAQDIHYAQCLSPVDWDKPDSSGAEQDDLFSF
ncbi:low density lipoprotein receptor adapter protein 1 isoform X1 [Equus przewalskii]|uniref:Low density lipoprotein receptor adapter protein 1 isoform X1 n=1 Tax=Equus przewalskii TaxID=9798 RepID=A0ABM4NPA6_EQUPR|nr:low density lipoprotein receptor adapter protein 1 isoform X2 [Equus caballus]